MLVIGAAGIPQRPLASGQPCAEHATWRRALLRREASAAPALLAKTSNVIVRSTLRNRAGPEDTRAVPPYCRLDVGVAAWS